MDRESEILRNQKEFQRFRKNLFEVHEKPGKVIAKKFENYIDENENAMPSPEDTFLATASALLETNETAGDVEVTTAALNAKGAIATKDGDRESQRGAEATTLLPDIVEDSVAAVSDHQRETVKEIVIDDDDDDDDDDNDDDDFNDAQDDQNDYDENALEEKKLDCES